MTKTKQEMEVELTVRTKTFFKKPSLSIEFKDIRTMSEMEHIKKLINTIDHEKIVQETFKPATT